MRQGSVMEPADSASSLLCYLNHNHKCRCRHNLDFATTEIQTFSILLGAVREIVSIFYSSGCMEGAVSEKWLHVPLLEGNREERRRQGMAWVHRQLGGQCSVCKKPSDLVAHSERDPTFKGWNRSFTNFDVHHPNHKSRGAPLFRLGKLYVSSARDPKAQMEGLLKALDQLKGCDLMCQPCHSQYYSKHGGHTFSRGVSKLFCR
jgi:hypothetical protein